MAKQLGGLLGPVIGKLGPSVGYLWRGQPVFRAYVRHIHYPNTERQQDERNWFVTMVRFAAAARPALLLGLRNTTAGSLLTEGNWFVQRNKQHFHRLEAPSVLSGRTHEGSRYQTLHPRPVAIDYARLAMSQGPVAPVAPKQATLSDDGILTVLFDRHSGLHRCKSGDNVYLYVYDATGQCGLLAAPVHRSSAHISLRLPDEWPSHDLHCYLFALDSQGFASSTSHITPLATSETALHDDTNEPTEKQVETLASTTLPNSSPAALRILLQSTTDAPRAVP